MGLTKKQLAVKESVIAKLKKEQASGDYEIAHCNADELLCKLLEQLDCKEVVQEFLKVGRWYA
tara:strand:+ start:672 stop:860 length:189 start_codon:yes stop_codon:yes gene_type:complete